MSWEKVRLENCVKLITGKTPPTSNTEYFEGDVLWVTPSDFKAKIIDKTSRTLSEKAIKDKKCNYLPENSVLLSCIGDIGKVGILKKKGTTNQQITALIPSENLSADYLYYCLLNKKIELNSLANNAVVPILNNERLKTLEIPLPPLSTQQKIAAILDKADALRRKDQELLKKYDDLAQAIFIDMFGDPVKNEKGWEVKSVINYCDCIVPGRDKPKSFSGNTPWITTDDLKHLSFTETSKKKYGLSDIEIKEVKARVIPENSVIMTCVGDLGIISINKKAIVINQQLHAFQCKNSIIPIFLMYSLSYQKDFMYKMASSTTVAYMNKTVCNSVPTICPPMDLQIKFSDKIQKLLSSKEVVLNMVNHSDNLFQSLLQKAFKGELT